ncbi:TetR/AcrR family transcriptional regulator [Maribacter sp. HTCC2170]|uniref:TetR/AcrR family transcriptional regulator n=1 Tax=Maribacter sp. (strain HTCC2170 / KCCM 42371) TaxID=313603 RepID=UPI00006AE5F1|nr:TetR/AcrR family transcriptional regulator [Maribacter sp. HTCC2170]EAR00440.1 putative TetR-family transcriptional regulator [Maribacter sp. HTCC2170]
MNNKYIDSGRKKQKLKTRNSILNTAQQFLTKGIDFSLEDVAKEAQVSRATIYRYYSNVDVLSSEAGLDLNTQSPVEINNQLRDVGPIEKILGIQEYFNNLTIDNEAAFRKYLSVVLASAAPKAKRGARRTNTLQLAIDSEQFNINKTELTKLTNIATLLMGIEAFIVTKDVCELSDQASKETLQWGLQMILKGLGIHGK